MEHCWRRGDKMLDLLSHHASSQLAPYCIMTRVWRRCRKFMIDFECDGVNIDSGVERRVLCIGRRASGVELINCSVKRQLLRGER
jgi:hypothetical protein